MNVIPVAAFIAGAASQKVAPDESVFWQLEE
jgi:hypothetical protein